MAQSVLKMLFGKTFIGKVYERKDSSIILSFCSFHDIEDATYEDVDRNGFKIVYYAKTMQYVKVDDNGEVVCSGIITRCPVCGKQLISNQEQWEPVKNHPAYLVSNKGHIKSFKRDKINGKISTGGKYINGYYHTRFIDHGKEHGAYVHDVVARAFIPNHFELPVINHKDGNRGNNDISNLEWCTYTYNNVGVLRVPLMDKNDVLLQWSQEGKLINIFHSFAEAGRAVHRTAVAISQSVRGKYNAAGYLWTVQKNPTKK